MKTHRNPWSTPVIVSLFIGIIARAAPPTSAPAKVRGKTAAQWLTEFDAARKKQNFNDAKLAATALEEFGPTVVPQLVAKWREMKYGEPPYGGLLYDLLLKQARAAAPLVMDGLDLPDQDAAQNPMHVVAAGGDAAIEPLRKRLADRQPARRQRAAQVLTIMAENPATKAAVAGAVPDLTKHVKDPDPKVRQQALLALARLGAESVPGFGAIVFDSLNDREIGNLPAELIGQVPLPELKASLPKLINLIGASKDPVARMYAVRAIALLKSDAAPAADPLAKLVRTPVPEGAGDLRGEALRALQAIGAAAVPQLVSLLDDPKLGMTQSVAESLGAMGAEAAQGAASALVKHLKGADDATRGALLGAIEKMGSAAEHVIPELESAAAADAAHSDQIMRTVGLIESAAPGQESARRWEPPVLPAAPKPTPLSAEQKTRLRTVARSLAGVFPNAQALHQQWANAERSRAKFFASLGEMDEALKVMADVNTREVIKDHEPYGRAEVLNYAATCAWVSGDAAEAGKWNEQLRELVRSAPGLFDRWSEPLVLVRVRSGDLGHAFISFPHDGPSPMLADVARELARLGRLDDAVGAAECVMTREARITCLRVVGEMCLARGDQTHAQRCFDSAIASAKGVGQLSTEDLFRVARGRLRCGGDASGVVRGLTRIRSVDKNHLRWVTRELIRRKDLAAARQAADVAGDADFTQPRPKRRPDPVALTDVARAQSANKDVAGAKAALDAAATAAMNLPGAAAIDAAAALARMAEAQREIPDPNAAKKTLAAAVDLLSAQPLALGGQQPGSPLMDAMGLVCAELATLGDNAGAAALIERCADPTTLTILWANLAAVHADLHHRAESGVALTKAEASLASAPNTPGLPALRKLLDDTKAYCASVATTTKPTTITTTTTKPNSAAKPVGLPSFPNPAGASTRFAPSFDLDGWLGAVLRESVAGSNARNQGLLDLARAALMLDDPVIAFRAASYSTDPAYRDDRGQFTSVFSAIAINAAANGDVETMRSALTRVPKEDKPATFHAAAKSLAALGRRQDATDLMKQSAASIATLAPSDPATVERQLTQCELERELGDATSAAKSAAALLGKSPNVARVTRVMTLGGRGDEALKWAQAQADPNVKSEALIAIGDAEMEMQCGVERTRT